LNILLIFLLIFLCTSRLFFWNCSN